MTTGLWHELEDKQAERLAGGYQIVKAKITGLGSLGSGIYSLTIDNKNHDVTTDTASGERGKFSWNSSEIADAFKVASMAYQENKLVTILYSEYYLSPHYDYDGDNLQPFYLKGIQF